MGSGDSGCCSMAEVNSLIPLNLILFSLLLLIFIVIIILSRRSVQETRWEGRRGSWRSGSRTSLTGLSLHIFIFLYIFIFIFIFNPWMIVI